jgi:putative transcriptional regulator
MRKCITALHAIICLLALAANLTRAQDIDSAVLLVAAANVEGVYRQAVVVALPVGNAQHVGFIINQPSKHTLASLFPKHALAKKVTDPIYIGGPDALGTIYAFVRTPGNAPAGALHLFDDLFVTTSPKALNRLVERSPDKARFATGYVSWMEGELEAEVEYGVWYICEPQAQLVFRDDMLTLWAELHEQALFEAVFADRHGRKGVNWHID